jgi:hypothetical protein
MPGAGMPGMPGGYGRPGMYLEEQEEDMNLVELAVYGIASLYERFPPKKEQPAADSTTPAEPSAGN